MKKKASGIALGASILAASFAPAMAGEAAPQSTFTPERQQTIETCIQKAEGLFKAGDKRNDTSIDAYYFDNPGHRDAILTALATNKYETENEMASLLGRHMSIIAFNSVSNARYECVLLSDENGDLPSDNLKEISDMGKEMGESHDQLVAIMKKLKTEGDKLLQAGARPPTNPNISLFSK